jgi:hypothetical protein
VTALVPHAPILLDGFVRSWNRGGGVGTVSLPGSLTALRFGRRAIDDATCERLREGAPCRFAIDEDSSVAAPRVARLVLAE